MGVDVAAAPVARGASSAWLSRLCLSLLGLAAVVVTLTATVRMTDSDAMGTLLAAESLIQGHGLALDHYPDLVTSVLGARVESIDGRLFYFFPIGTSLLVAPVIAILSALDIDIVSNDDRIQVAFAALAALLIVLLSYGLARRFVGRWTALLLAGVFWFGTAFASTGATALWSHDFGAVFSLAALLSLVVALQSQSSRWLAVSGVLAALGWIIRPQLLILMLVILALLLVRWRRGVLLFAPAWLFMAGAFAVFSKLTIGVWLPAYYLPERLEGGDFWVALGGTMISPGRGALLFAPLLLIVLLLLGNWRTRDGNERALVLLGLAWFTLQWVAIARFPHWWGGWGFGPRLMMDALPGMLLVVAVLWPRSMRTVLSRLTLALFVVLAAASIWINTVQGLYNPYTRLWYMQPSIDASPDIIWDWAYPQFLASESGHEAREVRRLGELPPMRRGVTYPSDAPELGLAGWSTGFWSPGISLDGFRLGTPAWWSEDGRRWTEGMTARIVFTMDESSVPAAGGRLAMSVDSYGPQRYVITVNGVEVGSGIIEGTPGETSSSRISAPIPPGLLTNGRNELALDLPDAQTVGKVTEFRQIALALRDMSLS